MAKVDNPKAGGDPSATEMETPAQKVRRMAQEAREAHKKEIEASVEGLRIERDNLSIEKQLIEKRLLVIREGLKEINLIDDKEAKKIPGFLKYRDELLAEEEERAQKTTVIDARFEEIESDPAMLEYSEQERIASELELARGREVEEKKEKLEKEKAALEIFERLGLRIKSLKEKLAKYSQDIALLKEERKKAIQKGEEARERRNAAQDRISEIYTRAKSLMSRLRDRNVMAISQEASTVPPIQADILADWFDSWMPSVEPAFIFGDKKLEELRALRDDPAFEQYKTESYTINTAAEIRKVESRLVALNDEFNLFLSGEGNSMNDDGAQIRATSVRIIKVSEDEKIASLIKDINEIKSLLDSISDTIDHTPGHYRSEFHLIVARFRQGLSDVRKMIA